MCWILRLQNPVVLVKLPLALAQLVFAYDISVWVLHTQHISMF